MSDKPEPITEYVHGAVGGKNYAVELAHHEGGSWAFIDPAPVNLHQAA